MWIFTNSNGSRQWRFSPSRPTQRCEKQNGDDGTKHFQVKIYYFTSHHHHRLLLDHFFLYLLFVGQTIVVVCHFRSSKWNKRSHFKLNENRWNYCDSNHFKDFFCCRDAFCEIERFRLPTCATKSLNGKAFADERTIRKRGKEMIDIKIKIERKR